MNSPMKICSKCKEEKRITDFPIVYGRKRNDGTRKKRVHSQCRGCRYNVCKRWRDKNPSYSKEKKTEWNKLNKKHIQEYNKHRRDMFPDKFKKWKKDWDAKNYDRILEYRRLKYPEMKDKIKCWNNKSRKKSRDELKDGYVIYTLWRRTGAKADFLRQYPELIKTQRLIIKTHRLCKTLQN